MDKERSKSGRGYAVSPDDSHLNDAAYDVLDTVLLNTLDDLD